MTVTLSLDLEVKKNLMALAHQRGISLNDYLQELVAREAGVPVAGEKPSLTKQPGNLSDLLLNSPFSGANLDLERSQDYPRSVELG